ncbi:MAG: helix-turn-helix domain-containing protein [Pseudomonadota bacterium]
MSPFSAKPLDAAQKIQLLALAVQMNAPKLHRSEIAVLTQLAQHQNPRTGRCNPSHSRLCAVLGLGRRTVQDAVMSLTGANLIRVQRTPGRSNSYRLASPELWQRFGSKMGATISICEKKQAQWAARGGALERTTHAQSVAPKKEKEKEKEKNAKRRKLQHVENTLIEALERQGIGYEAVLGLQTEDLQEVVLALASGKMTVKQAVKQTAASLLDL